MRCNTAGHLATRRANSQGPAVRALGLMSTATLRPLFVLCCVHTLCLGHQQDQSPFTCGSGSLSIPSSYVNDNFCDCEDGSDEPHTAACHHGQFQCVAVPSTAISKSKVGDGICDCCDGSDEAPEVYTAHGRTPPQEPCPTFCDAEVASAIPPLQEELQKVVQGLEKAAKFRSLYYRASSAVGGAWRRDTGGPGSRTAQKSSVPSNVKDFLAQVAFNVSMWTKNIKQRQEQSQMMRRHHPTSRAEYEQIRGALRSHAKHISFLKTQLQMHEHLTEDSFGPHGELFDLVHCGCFSSPVVSEIDLKGGSENQQPKKYRFFYCPFFYVIQVEVKEDKAAAENRQLGQESSTEDVASANDDVASDDSAESRGPVVHPSAGTPMAKVGGMIASAVSWLGASVDAIAARLLGEPPQHASRGPRAPSPSKKGSGAGSKGQAAIDAAFKEIATDLLGSGVDVEESDSVTTVGFYSSTVLEDPSSITALRSLADPPVTFKLKHTGGEHCALVMHVGGNDRSATVETVCGPVNRISRVVENGMCMYELTFETPFACSQEHAEELRRDIATAEARQVHVAEPIAAPVAVNVSVEGGDESNTNEEL